MNIEFCYGKISIIEIFERIDKVETLDLLKYRRSIRNYNDKAVSNQDLDTILKSANLAPVALGEYEKFHLTIIKEQAILDEVSHGMDNDREFLYGAPVFLLISTVEATNAAYSSAATITHNMAIAATDLGLGTCYIWGAVRALNKNEDLLEKLELPEGFTPACGITLGHFDEEYEEREIPTNRLSTNEL